MDLEPPSPLGGASGAQNAAAQASALAARLDRPVVLVGMMGVGKSSLGKKLASALGWPFVDADDEIEAAAQMTIPEIFAAYGETFFRDGERRVIARLLAGEESGVSAQPSARPSAHKVIATGGGAFVNPATRALILERALALWLDADLETLVERTARKDNRPLLQGTDPRETLGRLRGERAPFYAQAPLHVKSGNVPHARTLATVIESIAGWLDASGIPPRPEAS